MRNTRKLFVALVLVMTLLMTMAVAVIPASAATPDTLYLTPSANWKQSNARFAAYFFGNGEKWVSMTDSDKDGIYEVKVPTDKTYPNVIFCRMNPSATANNWNNKWNQTSDLVIPTSGANHYTVKEGTWDKGGGTWSTYGSTCSHSNLGPAATCTTAQVCNDCGDPVVSALGHNYNADHLCTRCNGQASFTVAGSGAHLGTEWAPGNTANDMTYADGVYTKVYTNVAAGSYQLKVARDHDWGTAYPDADKSYTVSTAGSTVTVTLKGTTVTIDVTVPHVHAWSDATCTEPQKCECGETQGEALGHDLVDVEGLAATCTTAGYSAHKDCSRCDYIEGKEEIDALGHDLVDVEGLAATCTTAGYSAHKDCSRCDYIEGKEEIDALGHTAGAEATCTTAQTCTVCGVELAAKLGHVDANLDIECDREGCTSKVAPKADSVLSTFTANCLGSKVSTSNKYYVVGTIVEVLDQKNGIFLVDDGTGETFYFRLPKNADGVAHASWEIKLTKGDKVQVYGAINKYSSSTAPNGQYWPAMQGPVVTLLEQHAHVAPDSVPCTKDRYCACGQFLAEAPGHIDSDANGICDNCPWNMNLVEVNIAIGTDPKYNGVRVDDEAGKALSWTWSNGGFDAVISKGTSTVTLYTTAKDYMQLKKQNLLTIVNTNDEAVQYVVISVTTSGYLTTLQTAIGTQYEFTVDEVNLTATIKVNSTEDIVLENKAASTVYVSGVSIVYAKKGAHVHEYTETVTTAPTCTDAGLKTFTCACGEGTYTEEIAALGHSFVKGICETCGAEDPDYCHHKDTGLDAKCDLCGEWFLPESPFKLEMYQASKKETYYFTGAMSDYYFATSTDITKAVDLYAEEVDGGYNVYFMSGTTKNYLYIELSGTHINAKFGSTKAVWYVDPTYGCLTTEVSGAKYFLGTYSNYVTFGGTAYTRLTASTADVSQYIGRAVSLENHECTNTTSSVTDPTCTEQGYTTYKCADCGLSTKGDYVDAKGHTYDNGKCECGAEDPNYVPVHEHSFTYSCDAHCAECGELVREASHNNVHVEAKAATCYENGNLEYWYCETCGQAWLDEACTRNTNLKAVVLPMAHAEATHVEAKAATCYENGNIEYWYCEACGQAWLDADCTRNTNLKAVVLPMAHAEATHVEAKAPTTTENGNIEYWYCEACGQAWLDADCTLNTNLKAVVLPMIVEDAPVDTPDEPIDTPDEPVVELTFFQRIWLAILDFFKKLFGLA